MTPEEQALRGPDMMYCSPYSTTMRRFACALNQRKPLYHCQSCATGSKLRKEYPGLLRQATERLKRVQIGADHQQALREIMGGQMEYDRDKREKGKPREGLRVG